MPLKLARILREEAFEEQRLTLEAAFRFADWARENLGASRVILFGSRSRDDWHRHSDCDILIVSEEFDGMPVFRRPLHQDLDRAWDGPVSLSVVCHTSEEFERSKAGGYIAAMALAEGGRDI
jgi:predicted nucleotidyltransferase